MLINILRTMVALKYEKISQMVLTRFQWGFWQCQGTSLKEHPSQVPIGQKKKKKSE